jgi:hypothetical protein
MQQEGRYAQCPVAECRNFQPRSVKFKSTINSVVVTRCSAAVGFEVSPNVPAILMVEAEVRLAEMVVSAVDNRVPVIENLKELAENKVTALGDELDFVSSK